jgi:hypothetical protein
MDDDDDDDDGVVAVAVVCATHNMPNQSGGVEHMRNKESYHYINVINE